MAPQVESPNQKLSYNGIKFILNFYLPLASHATSPNSQTIKIHLTEYIGLSYPTATGQVTDHGLMYKELKHKAAGRNALFTPKLKRLLPVRIELIKTNALRFWHLISAKFAEIEKYFLGTARLKFWHRCRYFWTRHG